MISQTLVSKARKIKFDLFLQIIDLNNVPLVVGTGHVKWHLPSSIAAEHRGRTDRVPIKEHKVTWDYKRTIPVRLVLDKSNVLQECHINLEVLQDYSSGGRGEKITLGHVTLNLAEYVEESEGDEAGDEGVIRRYLMQESKINSTLKISILMKQVEGERNYIAPPLKIPPVFGGIAGIIAGEQGEGDDGGYMPVVQKSRDLANLQDLYRHALAAAWQAQPWEMTVDDCIEDLFSNGDGFRKVHDLELEMTIPQVESPIPEGQNRSTSLGHRRLLSGSSQSTITGIGEGMSKVRSPKITLGGRLRSRPDSSSGIANTRETDSASVTSDSPSHQSRSILRNEQLLDEFDIREDLVAWKSFGPTEAT